MPKWKWDKNCWDSVHNHWECVRCWPNASLHYLFSFKSPYFVLGCFCLLLVVVVLVFYGTRICGHFCGKCSLLCCTHLCWNYLRNIKLLLSYSILANILKVFSFLLLLILHFFIFYSIFFFIFLGSFACQ